MTNLPDPAMLPVICLMGPTASGKTGLAVELVQRFPFEIISVDSAQIYRGMDIGTGKLDAAGMARAPHRLVDIRDPAVAYSASEFRADVIAEIDKVRALGKIPLLVGGTMLYFRVLRDGLANMPSADQNVRAEILAIAETKGWDAIHGRLAEVDPESAARIHPNDPQRLQRALEVYLLSGKSMTELHKEANTEAKDFGKLSFFALRPDDRAVLHQNIASRFKQMLADGFVEEVERLKARDDIVPELPSIRSVGYRQVWGYLAGEYSYDAMEEKGIIATRQLAKRQLTWLRNWQNLRDLSFASTKSVDQVLKFMDSISI